MEVEMMSVAELCHDPANVRKHSDRNLESIKASLLRFGQQKPLVVDAGGVVRCGNGTLLAAKALGWDSVSIVRTKLRGAEATAYAIADNRTAELAGWDDEALAQQLAALKIDDESLALATGYTEQEIGAMVIGSKELTDDAVPEPPTDPVTKRGDLWVLGDHRLLCGDSTDANDVKRLMAGAKADMMLTDPPYGVSYVGKTKDALTVENDNLDEEALTKLITAAFDNAQANCRGGAYWYATVAGVLHIPCAIDWKRRGILRQIMVWAKDTMVFGRSEYHYQHETILFGWLAGDRHKNSDRTRTTLWQYSRPKASREHPTMKPVALWGQALQDGSVVGEAVYDPFLGSGTTVVAAEQLGRRCYGTEISPSYCDVIVKRWEALTGRQATRA